MLTRTWRLLATLCLLAVWLGSIVAARAQSCFPPPAGLVSWWAAEGNANDFFGTNNGTLVGAVGFSAGEVGEAFNLNGTSQYVDVPNSATLNPTGSITLEAWIYPPQSPGAGPVIKKAGEGSAQQDGYSIEFDSGELLFGVYANGGWRVTGSASVPLSQWSHVAGVYDGTNLSLYVNGSLAGTPVPAAGQISPSGNDLQIGHDPSSPTRYFSGLIDEASIYNTALSAAQIHAIYAAASAGKCGTPPVIVSQPANLTVLHGSNATFSVTATGPATMSYQWLMDGSNILATATNSSLVLTNVQVGQSGSSYSVVVRNAFGTTNSSNATLTVIPPVVPSTSDLWDVSQGSVVTGTSGANSPNSDNRDMFGGDFSYVEPGHTIFHDGKPAGFVHYVEWQTPVPVTLNSFNLFASGDGAQYNNQREFSQFVLKAKSSPAAADYDLTLYTLAVTNHPYTFVDPINQALVSANITPVTAQYFRAEFTQYTVASYNNGPRIIELDGFGPNPPVILTQPAGQNALTGMDVTFAVVATGAAPLSYQWVMNGSNLLTTATNATLVLTNVQPAESGSYSVVVSNVFGVTNTIGAVLTVIPPVIQSTSDLWDISQGSIVTATSPLGPGSDVRDMFGGTYSTAEPGNMIFADGEPAGFVHYVQWETPVPVTVSSFALFAAGDGAQYNNEREFGQFVLKAKSSALVTNYDLTLFTLVVTNHPYVYVDPVNQALVAANITPVMAQYFRAEFTQYTAGRGFDGPRVIELDGFGPNSPVVFSGPASQAVPAGMDATFTVSVTGAAPFAYQWLENGTNIPAAINATATNATLILNNVQTNLSGNQYSVLVSNLYGATKSASALLTVFTIHFADLNSRNPVPPFFTWATAATNIQDAVDATATGDEVLVTNGVYQAGGRTVPPYLLTNRLVIANAISVQSVNGPAVTLIKGVQVPVTINGPSAVRCVYLSGGASLSGFTLLNGATASFESGDTPSADESGGGIYCSDTNELVTNCVIAGNSAALQGGGLFSGTVINCNISSNSELVQGGVLNLTVGGGGSFASVLKNCALAGNSGYNGGGAAQSTMINCSVSGNTGFAGGGAYGDQTGMTELNNCLIVSNSAFAGGGGACVATLKNCTVTMNSDSHNQPGGVSECTLYNCIIYSNTATLSPPASGGNYDGLSALNFCCTTPLPTGGTGNITNDPLFVNATAGNFHLQPVSPCIDAGNSAYVTTQTDLGGNPRVFGIAVDMGAYELPVHYVDQNCVNSVPPFSSWAAAATNIQDAVSVASNYDGVLVTNGIYAYGGDGFSDSDGTRVDVSRPMTIQSVNGPGATVIEGNPVFDTTAVRCVSLSGGDELIGFTLTSGGTWRSFHGPPPSYDVGGGVRGMSGNSVVSNCIIVGNGSVSGGGAGCDPVYTTATMTLYNCILSSNTFSGYGGGANGCTLINCQLIGNSAPGSGYSFGGGAAYCKLYNCAIASNSEVNWGGGAYASTLDNSILAANSANNSIGGADDCTLNNCILVSNSSPNGANFDETTGDVLSFCCTFPLPTNGIGNITNDPLFVNPAAGDFHLQSNSPCINSGNNAYVSTTTDLDGNPRISGGTVDIGAYEFQNPASTISYAWLQQFGLPTDGSADFIDSDHNGMNNWQKWIAGLDPTNPLSILQMLSPSTTTNPPGLVVTWQSVSNVNYYLQRATNLTIQPAFQPLATNLPGQPGTTSFTDTNAPAPGPWFYRVGVQQP